ncbi:MAG: CotH kinase family protein [Saprospiraceae bacterium]|nr:CotH kinase family protein [Saprospiraceae bacterium]
MINNTFIYLTVLVCFFICPLSAQFEGDEVFDESYIHEIQITTDANLSELTDLFLNELFTGSFTYTLADVVIDGNSMDSIGVRVKGGISSFDPKKPLKLDFNRFVSGQKYDGLKKLNLHQGNLDPSFMREALAYGLMRNAGVKTVRTSFAKVYFNGEYEGIYTLVEQVDDEFIHRNFASAKGALYKKGGFGFDLKYELDDSFTITDLETAINQIPIDQLHEQLPHYIDVESLIRFFTMEIFLNAVDGPFTDNLNYYIYFEPKSRTYVYIPWDYNLPLYGGANHTILKNGANFIFEKVKQNPVLRARYLSTFCELLQYNLVEDRIQSIITSYRNLLEEEMPNDPYIDKIGDYEAGIALVENVISARVQDLTAEMNADFSPCSPLVNPFGEEDVAINEIVASNDPSSGITDPAGGSADWIELYNTTSEDISLSSCYLSNDADFLKHWKFPDDLVLPANEYLIIWADRDVQEEGLHADFKLNKTIGELYLSFENGYIIDSVRYEDQSTNVGLARVPNGTGPFIQQTTTFKSTNNISTSTKSQEEELGINVYPNPAIDRVGVQFFSMDKGANVIQIFNLQGQLVYKTEVQVVEGNNQIELDVSQINGGVYNLNLTNLETNKTRSIRLALLD